MKRRVALLALCVEFVAILSLSVLQGRAAEESPATAPTTILPNVDKWTIHPALAGGNPMQYRLLPDAFEQRPGNAVPLYLMSRQFWPDQKTTDEILWPENHRYDYLDTPIEQFPQEDAHKLLDAYSDTLAFVDRAARRQSAVWDDNEWPDVRFGAKAFAYRDDLRHAGNLLTFRARFQISQDDWSGAIHTLQTSFSMARQFGSEPMLIHAIESSGFGRNALEAVPEWITRRNSPNLYWALSDLPDPFVELAAVAQYERTPSGQTPLDQAMRGELPAELWGPVVQDMIGRLQEMRPPFKRNQAGIEAEATRLVASVYPRAKEYLISAGISKEKVNSMAPEEAVGTYFCRQAVAASDQLWKCWSLPYPQAQEQMLRSWKALAPDQPPLLDNPLFQGNQVWISGPTQHPNYDFPSLLRWRYSLTAVDREIALFRTVEALRDYAARHDDVPPASLDEITDLPVPLDPATDKPFDYSVQGQTVHLDALTPWWPRNGWRLELTLAK
jgi:hypothetical protein